MLRVTLGSGLKSENGTDIASNSPQLGRKDRGRSDQRQSKGVTTYLTAFLF